MDPLIEARWRMGFFLAGLIAFTLAGLFFSVVKQSPIEIFRRWRVNLGMTLFNAVAMRLMFGYSLYRLADWAHEQHIGLFSYVVLPVWIEVLLAFLIFDVAIYWQHRLFHRLPLLWRLHRMHHSDLAMDTTTALRFHLLELVLSMLIKMALVLLMAPVGTAILVFEIALNFLAMFNHANIDLPSWIERPLRLMLITPTLHRRHHGVNAQEHRTNFGFCLSLWDILFKSFSTVPVAGKIGLNDFRAEQDQTFYALLEQPWRGHKKED